MKDEEIGRLLSSYLDGEVSKTENDTLVTLLKRNPRYQKQLDQLALLRDETYKAGDIQLSPQFASRVILELRGQIDEDRVWLPIEQTAIRFAMALVLVVSALVFSASQGYLDEAIGTTLSVFNENSVVYNDLPIQSSELAVNDPFVGSN
jgi:hypothetical protein